MINLQTRRIIPALAALALCLGICTLPAAAQTGRADSSGYTVQAIIPDNQIDRAQTYFDLRMEPGQTQVLQVSVNNDSGEDMVLDIALHTATTNRNGLIEYRLQGEPDSTLPHAFHDLARTESELAVPAGGSRVASITLTMPEEPFDGALLGGIVFTKRLTETGEGGFSINNRFSYVIGVRLTETDEEIRPDFDLLSVEESLINYRGAVVASIQNPRALIVKDAQAAAAIYRRGEDTPLYAAANNRVDFAPNSVFPFPTELDGDRMEPGDYRMAVTLTHEGRVWSWDEDFTITAAQADAVNEAAVNLEPEASNRWRYLLWILILLLIVATAAYYLGKKSRRRTDDGADA